MNGYEDIDNHLKILYYYKPILDQLKKYRKYPTEENNYYDLAEVLTGVEIVDNRNRDRKFLSKRELLLGHGYRRYPSVTRYCPKCLVESKYHRLHWSMIPVIICEKHKCFLEYKCSSCNQPINLKATVTGKCSLCETTLISSHISNVNKESLENNVILTGHDYFSRRRVYLHFNYHQLFRLKKWLMFCIISCLQNLQDKEVVSIQYSKISNVVSILDSDLDRVRDFLIFTDSLIANWPSNLMNYLEKEYQTGREGEF
ncbi:TniQ family protein [Paenibacillus beijingensis]|uniref:TniQ family protein n=1 Tax=Paenibacillus beijingensis TaxID=1126833 RepID=UPI0009E26751|nr:TniQ family protein [Paenibacillus beijingensis]